ncbi:penicillin-binding transpeptidase domain-containing protein [Streptomyces albireticuli]|uniref:Penicillin-binding protein n=1 Tax=Streptomyces albireticuli TaxID=1940 RepID=A0A2A2DF66_9ACTN|nr:penicillin-binding transpeptidase domain-containing protein [Streptomyces albireticuli]MCD9195314.1 penicillin-binding protein [Streptomyces albireticuli]PAU49970.1 penicillin-binding protein [Streptomyces albireticuli]
MPFPQPHRRSGRRTPSPASADAPVTRAGRRRRTALLTSAAAVALAAATGGAYAAGWGPFATGAPSSDPAALTQARAFLADWAAGRLTEAGGRTTSPGPAESTLRNFTAGLEIGKPVLIASTATTGRDGTVTVPFTAKMPVTGLGTWTYASKLPLREQRDGTWKVDWALSLVHPKLNGTDKFRLERGTTEAVEVSGRGGAPLSGRTYPSLAPVIARLGKAAGGGPRGSVQVVDRVTGEAKGTVAIFGGAPARTADGPVRTTIDPVWQAAAEKALAAKSQGKNAALVALRADTGEILAMANSPASGFNRAVSGTYAPGSTWKIVTSTALLLKGAVEPGTVVDCPKYLTVGKQFHNVELGEHRGATFAQDFTESCNTAFISLRDKLGDREPADVARKYFGIGQKWNIGIPSFDGAAPATGDATDKAAAMIGQGKVLGNPLTMASVTATAASGTFRQPTLLPGTHGTTTTTPLPKDVTDRLRAMMRATVTEGTAKGLADLPGDVGAKTGTAEVSEQAPNNGWIAAHRGGIAVAAVVEGGLSGSASAVPLVHDVLAAVPADRS